MDKDEFIQKIKKNSDIMFDINEKHYTILTWCDDGISICEQNSTEKPSCYSSAEELVNNYKVQGMPIGQLAPIIKITDYTIGEWKE